MTTKTEQLIAIRASLQTLIDNYQIREPGEVAFKSALVDLQTVIDTPDPAPEVIKQPVVGTDAVVQGVLAGLAGVVTGVQAASTDIAQVIEQCEQLRTAIVSVEADTAQLRVDTGKIITNTTPTPQ